MILDRKILILGVVLLFVVVPIFLWLLITPFSLRFANITVALRSIGQLCGLVGMALFSLNFLLAARIKIFDNLFHGLNRVYLDHHTIGAWAFILLLVHPLALTLRFLSTSVAASGMFLFSAVTELSMLLGTIGLLLMMALLIFTFYIQLRYHVWKFSHKFLALAFGFGFFHMLFVTSDVSVNSGLRIYMIFLGILSFIAIFYRVLFSKIFVRRYSYVVEKVSSLTNNVIEVIFTPRNQPMVYRAGQFAYFQFEDSKNISREEHPFSIASNPQDSSLKIVTKDLGDYTTKMSAIQPGSLVSVEGPFGIFLKDNPKNQIWIAGGIGITPFLGKLGSLPAESNIFIFYCVNNKEELLYKDAFEALVKENPHFHFIPWISKDVGYLTAEKVKEIVKTISENFEINICGPAPFMAGLRTQFVAMGLKNKNIKSEEFSF